MQKEYLDAVRTRYHFDEWKGINRLEDDLELHDVAPPERLIPALKPEGIREIDPGDGTRLLRMRWFEPEHEGSLLLMDLRECESRDQAHEVLLEYLANMQAPDVSRLDEDAPGDIAFALDPSSALVFARGNLVISLSNGARTKAPADEVAQKIDQWIMKQD